MIASSSPSKIALAGIVTIAAAATVGWLPAAPAAGARAAAGAVVSPASWGQAQEVPGTAALNKAGSAAVTSVSCPSAGNCGVVGNYSVINGGYLHARPFVAGEKNGRWLTAGEMPGTLALSDRHRSVTISSVSCASAGNCSAGGDYLASSGHAGVRGQRDQRHLGQGRAGARHRRPQHRRDRRDHLGVVRLGGQLQRGRVLRRQAPAPPGVRGQRGRTAPGARPSEVPGTAALNTAATPRSTRCRAPRRATAARAATTPTAPATSRRSWSAR